VSIVFLWGLAFETNLKHRLDCFVTVFFLSLWGGIGCVVVPQAKNVQPLAGDGKVLPFNEDAFMEVVVSPLNQSGGIALSGNGDLFFANFEKEGVIGKLAIDLNHTEEVFIDLTEWVSPVGEFSSRAEGLRVDNQGRLLVADAGTGKLLRISPTAHKLEILADSYDGYRFGSVKDLAVAPNGDLFVSSPYSGTIYRIRPDIGYVGILNDDLVRVQGLAISPDGKQLVAAEPEASRVVVYDIPDDFILVDSWTLVDFSPSGVEPRGVAFDEKGRLFLALGQLNQVRAFDLDMGVELVRYEIGSAAESIAYRNGSLFIGGDEKITRIRLWE
jgi:sugar lactone lactonase YvrE